MMKPSKLTCRHFPSKTKLILTRKEISLVSKNKLKMACVKMTKLATSKKSVYPIIQPVKEVYQKKYGTAFVELNDNISDFVSE